MTSKTIKTILFASLIAAMILPFSGMDFAEAKEQPNKIPEDKLVDRPVNWKIGNMKTADIEDQDSKFRQYVKQDHPNNDWNKTTKKNQIIMYNFDSIAGELKSGLNALVIDVQNQKNNGVYNPTEPEKKFHDWAIQQVQNPTIPDMKPNLIRKVIQTYNESANYGHVPQELFTSDADYWSNVVADKLCEFNKECNTDGPQLGLDPVCEIIQCAEAAEMSIGHLLTVNMEVTNCWGGPSCHFADDKWLIGSGSLSISSGDVHSEVKRVYYYINDKSYYTPYDESHTVDGTVYLGYDSYSIPEKTANNSVTIDSSKLFSGSCNGNPPNCGTYSLTANADDVIIEY